MASPLAMVTLLSRIENSLFLFPRLHSAQQALVAPEVSPLAESADGGDALGDEPGANGVAGFVYVMVEYHVGVLLVTNVGEEDVLFLDDAKGYELAHGAVDDFLLRIGAFLAIYFQLEGGAAFGGILGRLQRRGIDSCCQDVLVVDVPPEIRWDVLGPQCHGDMIARCASQLVHRLGYFLWNVREEVPVLWQGDGGIELVVGVYVAVPGGDLSLTGVDGRHLLAVAYIRTVCQ